ncbi:MAG: hypothetical protein HY716_14975, partial [Planctomycetes bacterium]|nr:hypothetical protein [Planctomycetota bacterium]
LAARSGLRIDASAVKLEGETASLKLESGTAMQALDLLCAGRSNLSWEWKEGGAVKMTSSPHVAYPSVYSGPFKVYISSLNIVRHTNFKETTATLSLGISTLYETHLNPMKGVKFEFGKGVDDTGSELSVETSGEQIQAGAGGWAIQVVQGALGGGGGGPTPDASAQVFSVKGLAPEAKSIKSLPGTVTFSFPLEHTEISFESPSRGDTKESGDFVFRIEKIEKNGITFKVSSKKKDGPAIDMARLLDSESAKAVDDEGKTHKADTLALAQTNEGGMVIRMIGGAGGVFGVESSTETLYRATFSTVKGRDIETFTFRFIDRTLEKVVPFELRDVKLP